MGRARRDGRQIFALAAEWALCVLHIQRTSSPLCAFFVFKCAWRVFSIVECRVTAPSLVRESAHAAICRRLKRVDGAGADALGGAGADTSVASCGHRATATRTSALSRPAGARAPATTEAAAHQAIRRRCAGAGRRFADRAPRPRPSCMHTASYDSCRFASCSRLEAPAARSGGNVRTDSDSDCTHRHRHRHTRTRTDTDSDTRARARAHAHTHTDSDAPLQRSALGSADASGPSHRLVACCRLRAARRIQPWRRGARPRPGL